ncbi:MAG: hypothetical protein ABI472_08900 [Ginsengibacter sp.]
MKQDLQELVNKTKNAQPSQNNDAEGNEGILKEDTHVTPFEENMEQKDEPLPTKKAAVNRVTGPY